VPIQKSFLAVFFQSEKNSSLNVLELMEKKKSIKLKNTEIQAKVKTLMYSKRHLFVLSNSNEVNNLTFLEN
jgi:hypothetical protein